MWNATLAGGWTAFNCQHRIEGYMNNANLSLILCRWYSFRWNAYQADQCSTSWAGDCLLHTLTTWDCIQHSVPPVQLHLQREAVSVQAIQSNYSPFLFLPESPLPAPHHQIRLLTEWGVLTGLPSMKNSYPLLFSSFLFAVIILFVHN